MYAAIRMITESYACSPERCTLLYVRLHNHMSVLKDVCCYTYDYTIIVCSERCTLLCVRLQNPTPVLLIDARCYTYDYTIICLFWEMYAVYVWLHNLTPVLRDVSCYTCGYRIVRLFSWEMHAAMRMITQSYICYLRASIPQSLRNTKLNGIEETWGKFVKDKFCSHQSGN